LTGALIVTQVPNIYATHEHQRLFEQLLTAPKQSMNSKETLVAKLGDFIEYTDYLKLSIIELQNLISCFVSNGNEQLGICCLGTKALEQLFTPEIVPI